MSAAVASKKTVKIEDEHVDAESVSSQEEEHVHGEHCNHGHDHTESSRQIGRKERAARKELSKLGLKRVASISRVTFKRQGGPIFAVNNAEVYVDPTSGAYIVYGQPVVETHGMNAQAMAAQRLAQHQAESMAGAADDSAVQIEDDEAEDNAGNEEAEVEEDTTGMDEKDIKIVMDQANVSRTKAIKSLRANKNDIVNAIMELTM